MSASLIALITQLIPIAIQVIPELAAAEKTIVGLLTSGADPTSEEQAQIDAALDAIKAKVDAGTQPPTA